MGLTEEQLEASIEQLREQEGSERSPSGSAAAFIGAGILLAGTAAVLMQWFLSGGPSWTMIALVLAPAGVGVALYGLNQWARDRQRPS